MPIRMVKHITRDFVRANPHDLFVFGDNLAGRGFGGQARAMRGQPNAVGIPTKRRPDMDESSFFTDADLAEVQAAVEPALQRIRAHLESGKFVILPEDGIGTGLAQLPQRAPAIDKWLRAQLLSLAFV